MKISVEQLDGGRLVTIHNLDNPMWNGVNEWFDSETTTERAIEQTWELFYRNNGIKSPQEMLEAKLQVNTEEE